MEGGWEREGRRAEGEGREWREGRLGREGGREDGTTLFI